MTKMRTICSAVFWVMIRAMMDSMFGTGVMVGQLSNVHRGLYVGEQHQPDDQMNNGPAHPSI